MPLDGLLESTYRTCLEQELRLKRLKRLRVAAEVPIAICHKGIAVDSSYRADLIVEDLVLLELKAVEKILPVHFMQTLSYLKHANLPIGYLINFNVPTLKSGIRRFANFHTKAVRPGVALPPRS